MTRIDVGAVLRHSAHLPYADLVTRSTGAAVRRCIERELAALHDGDVALLDFSHIGMIDYSCADEVVAKLLLTHGTFEEPPAFVVFLGITDVHLEAIEDVLLHHGLALVVHFADGGARLVGAVTDEERRAWEFVYERGLALPEDLVLGVGRDPHDVGRTLESLFRRRLVRRNGPGYVPVGAVT